MNLSIFNRGNIGAFLKKECVLIISIFLAIITSFISAPKLEYIDFKVLILLFNLMIIVAAFKNLKVLDFIAISVLSKCNSYRLVNIDLVFTTFIASMLVTNDVALITFVPLTVIIGKKINMKVLNTVVLQTIAANLGSSLTPMGNPQNIFIYTFYNVNPLEFLKTTYPIVTLGGMILIGIILFSKNKTLEFDLEKVSLENKGQLLCFTALLIIILLSVFHILDYRIVFIITIVTVAILNRKLFFKVDYSLLLTFIGFFIFVGNISNMDIMKSFMKSILNDGNSTYFLGILSSEVISNVPATMLLSGFTKHYKELLLSVNIGGVGTLIASLASIISYKLYVNEYKDETVKYLKVFTIYNFAILVILTIVIKLIML